MEKPSDPGAFSLSNWKIGLEEGESLEDKGAFSTPKVQEGEDSLVRKNDERGKFSVKSFFFFIGKHRNILENGTLRLTQKHTGGIQEVP